MKIGVLSDTHGYLDPKIEKYFKDVDEIWHAGDIGSLEVIDTLKSWKPLRAVYGNIDDHLVRRETKLIERFTIEKLDVLLTHIAGKPGRYSNLVNQELSKNGVPQLLVCGHSHILFVKMDASLQMMNMNPGACGKKGFHKVNTILRFEVNGTEMVNLEAIELGLRGKL